MKSDQVICALEHLLSGRHDQAVDVLRQIHAHERKAGNGTVARRIDRLLSRAHGTLVELPNAPSSLAMWAGERSLDSIVLPPSVRTEVVFLIREWRLRQRLLSAGIPLRRSLLLHGPSGNGKTALVQALATELNLPLAVACYQSLVDSYRGSSAKEISTAFEFINQSSCVVLFDEADTVISERITGAKDSGIEDNRSLNQLLMSLDQLRGDSLVVFATNMPECADKALKRRISLSLELPAPGPMERNRMVDMMRQKWPMATGDWAKKAQSANCLADIEQFALSAAREAILADEETREVA